MTAPALPDHAYVPGQTPRHAEDAFLSLRNTVNSAMSESELAASQAFRAGLQFLDHGFYWEAHEVLEPVWMACPPNSQSRVFVQALIQLANARLKLVMNRASAAQRLFAIAARHLDEVHTAECLGLSVSEIRKTVTDSANI